MIQAHVNAVLHRLLLQKEHYACRRKIGWIAGLNMFR